MRFCRFTSPDGGPRYGIVEGQAVVEVEGDIFERYGATSQIYPIDEIELLAPVEPSKIVALGTNFHLHAKEMGREVPDEPKIFLKPPSALIGHQATIVLPKVPGRIDHEAEVAIIVKRLAKNVSAEEALDYVLGYTCFNDVSARALQEKDGVFARAKGFDTFAPAGPWLQTDLVWEKLEVEGWVNGERRQHGALSDLIFGVPQVIAFVSRVMTLLPGDMIALGTPVGVGPLADGDRVQVKINGLGTLENPVAQE